MATLKHTPQHGVHEKERNKQADTLLQTSYLPNLTPYITPLNRYSPSSPHQIFLIGHPISHSLAPLLHNTVFRSLIPPSSPPTPPSWTYTLHETPSITPTEFLSLIKSENGSPSSSSSSSPYPNFTGCAITMPYKVSLIPALDDLTPEARALGAVNTVFVRYEEEKGGEKSGDKKKKRKRYIGANTDTIGVRDSFLRGFSSSSPDSEKGETETWWKGKPGLVIGGGGACRAAVYALLKWFDCSVVYIVNRDEAEVRGVIEGFGSTAAAAAVTSGNDGGDATEGEEEGLSASKLRWVGSVEEAKELEAPFLVVGTVPDLEPRSEEEKRAGEVVRCFLEKGGDGKKKGYVLEMCYHPRPKTAFYEMAKGLGWEVLMGTEALVAQAVAQEVLWLEIPESEIPVDEARRVIREAVEAEMGG